MVNIPVDFSEMRGVLGEIPTHEIRTKAILLPESRKGGNRKRKRRVGKENVSVLRTDTQVGSVTRDGLKRQWQLQDEDDEMDQEGLNSKRTKRLEMIQDANNFEVGVASLKWHQLDQ